MKKLALVFLVVLIMVVGVAAGLYFGGFLRPPEIQAVRMSWGEVTAQETKVNGEVRINNRLPVGLGSSAVGLEVPVDFYNVPAFSLTLPQLRLEKGESTLSADGTLRQAELPRWWPQFVNSGEVLAIRVRPKVRARLLGRQLGNELPAIQTTASIPLLDNMGSDEARTVGFDIEPASAFDILTSPGETLGTLPQHFVVHPPDPQPAFPILTIVSWELHWGAVTQATTQVQGTIVVQNETPLPLPVQGLGLGLDMNGIQVVPDGRVTPDRPVLPPGEPVPLRLAALIDNQKLVEWWTSHLQQGEETAVTARIGVTVVLPAALLGRVDNDVELPLIPVPGFRCVINTDIMGVANYEVARAIGTEAGQRPESHKVDCAAPPAPTLGEAPGIPPGATPPPTTGGPALPTPPPVPPLLPTLAPLPVLALTPTPSPGSAPIGIPASTPVPTYSMHVSVTPIGGGTVVLMPPGGKYPQGTEVSLTAMPAPGYSFDHWSGDGSGTSPIVTVRMDTEKSIVAHFRRLLP